MTANLHRKTFLLLAMLLGVIATDAAKHMDDHADRSVTLLDFTVDEDSYQLAQAAMGLSDMVRVVLAKETSVRWVERAQLCLNKQEMDLVMFSQASPGNSLRIGAMSCADLAIMGNITANTNGTGWGLSLDILDLRRADVLATQTLILENDDPHTLIVSSNDIQSVTSASLRLLEIAKRYLDDTADQPVVAPLFLNNLTPWMELDPLVVQWGKTLSSAAKKQGMRCLCFPKVLESTDEAGLAFNGYSRADALNKNWLKVADLYVWGEFNAEETEQQRWEDIAVNIRLTVCNAAGSSTNVQAICRIADIDSTMLDMAENALAFNVARQRETMAQRTTIADLLCSSLPLESSSSWDAIIRAYQLAHFFDPLNREAWFHSLAIKDHGRPMHFGGWKVPRTLRGLVADIRAWNDYYDMFGLDRTQIRWGGDSRYIKNNASLLYMLTKRENRYLREMPDKTYEDWRSQTESELFDGVVEFMKSVGQDECWNNFMARFLVATFPMIKDPYRRVTYVEMLWDRALQDWRYPGRDMRSKKLMAEIRQAYIDIDAEDRYRQLTARVATSPSDGELTFGGRSDFLLVPRLPLEPLKIVTDLRAVKPDGLILKTVSALLVQGNRLWVAGGSGRRRNSGWAGHLHEHCHDTLYDANALLVIDSRHPESSVCVTNSKSMPRINALLANENAIWAAPMGNGLLCCRLDGASLDMVPIRAEGIADHVYALARDDYGDIYVGGKSSRAASLTRWSVEQETWIPMQLPVRAGKFGHLGEVNVLIPWGDILIADRSLHTIYVATRPRYEWRSIEELWPVNRLLTSSVTEEGLWLGLEGGLMLIGSDHVSLYSRLPPEGLSIRGHDPRQNTNASLLEDSVRPKTRLPGSVTTLAKDESFLWMGVTTVLGKHSSTETNFLIAMHMPTKKWVGALPVPGRIRTLAVEGNHVWMGLESPAPDPFGTALLMTDKRPFLSRPADQWQDDTIPECELQGCIDLLPAHDQAKYAFYLRDYPKAVSLLEPMLSVDKDRDVACLFLGWCYDNQGLDQPDKARAYFMSVLNESTNALAISLAKAGVARMEKNDHVLREPLETPVHSPR